MTAPRTPGGIDASVIAPDTRGMNFYRADEALRDLLALYLADDLRTHLEPHLDRLGALAAGELDECAALADRHPPVLHQRDRFGRDRQWIEYHPAYRRLETVAYGEFGIHAMSHRPILGWPKPLPAVAKHAFTLLFNEAEFGLGCPINVTDSAAHLISRFGDDAIKARFLPRMLSQDMTQLWQGAQFMTEQEGGSDVGQLISRATRTGGGEWRIHGEKWFCSNADAAVVTLLARPDGAPEGTRGLGLFVMPRMLADGSPNRYRIVRLKDKLGTRSMASGEVSLDGAIAYPLGHLDAGFKQMAEMINWSRLSNGVKSTALMRRAVHDAWQVYRHRQVFGSRLLELPLAQRQLLKIQLPSEQALSMSFFTADALDEAEYPGRGHANEARAVLRLATPVLKLRATRDARRVTGDAMEVRGGCGYVEDFVNPRLLRDAHLGSIWEGTSNIVGIDAIRRAIGRNGCQEAYQAALLNRLELCSGLPVAFIDELRTGLHDAIELAEAADAPDELWVRQAVTALYHASSAILLAWEGCETARRRGDARRVLWARLALDHGLYARGPLTRTDRDRERAIAKWLLGDVRATVAEVAPLLDR